MKVNITAQKINEPQKKGTTVIALDEGYIEILLGETKYFQAKLENDELIIEELKESVLNSGIADNAVWGNNPVVIDSSRKQILSHGKRLGVYWETEKPILFYNNENKLDTLDMLPTGIIRIIGRYWHVDSMYNSKLIAKYENKTKIVKIKNIKPMKLGDTRNLSRDVFNNEYNVDSLVIHYAGLYGMSPQIIKGQIDKESPDKDFGTYTSYTPAYRYEPFTEEIRIQKIVDLKHSLGPNNPYRVTETEMSAAGAESVPDHQNTKYIPYATTPQTVWDMVTAYSDLDGDCPSSQRIYGRKESDGRMTFRKIYGYKSIQLIYNSILNIKQGNKKNPTANDITAAYDSIVVYLRDSWNGGLDSMIAQTRIASSYGLQQLMYGTAVDRGYLVDNQHCPEELNINNIFYPFCMKHQKYLLKEILGSKALNENNWSGGYDDIFFRMLNNWNPKMANYEQDVMLYSKNYLPKK
jgi:hypothetical protein